jgi:hypothetical protein
MSGRLYVTRPHPRKPGFVTGEWLRGGVEKCDAPDEAQALLEDPRDTISGVYFWSNRFNQFDGTWRKA